MLPPHLVASECITCVIPHKQVFKGEFKHMKVILQAAAEERLTKIRLRTEYLTEKAISWKAGGGSCEEMAYAAPSALRLMVNDER